MLPVHRVDPGVVAALKILPLSFLCVLSCVKKTTRLSHALHRKGIQSCVVNADRPVCAFVDVGCNLPFESPLLEQYIILFVIVAAKRPSNFLNVFGSCVRVIEDHGTASDRRSWNRT